MSRNELFLGEETLRDNLPLPPTVESILQTAPELSPVKEADFLRLEHFFAQQKEYFTSMRESADDDETKDILETWIKRTAQLGEIIRANTRLITEDLFRDAILSMRQELEPLLDVQYLVFLHGKDDQDARNHSTFFVAQEMGLSQERFITQSDLKDPRVQNFINSGGRILIVDDGAYSSQNILEHFFDIKRDCYDFSADQLFVSLVGITNYAIKRLEDENITNISAQFRIPEIAEFLSAEDRRIMRFMERVNDHGELEQIPSSFYEVLTLFWQKVPDNFCHPLRKWYNKYWDGAQMHFWEGYLVDDLPGGIYPDYRKGKKYIFS